MLVELISVHKLKQAPGGRAMGCILLTFCRNDRNVLRVHCGPLYFLCWHKNAHLSQLVVFVLVWNPRTLPMSFKFYSHFTVTKCHYNDVIMGAIASKITSLTIAFSNVYSDADQRKHQSSASLAFVQGIHRGPVNSQHKVPVTRKMFPFDDVIMQSDSYTGTSGLGWVKNAHELENSRALKFSLLNKL